MRRCQRAAAAVLTVLVPFGQVWAQTKSLDVSGSGEHVLGGPIGGMMGPYNGQVRSVPPDQFVIHNELQDPVNITVFPDNSPLPPLAPGADMPLPCGRVTAIQIGTLAQHYPVACEKTYDLSGNPQSPRLTVEHGS